MLVEKLQFSKHFRMAKLSNASTIGLSLFNTKEETDLPMVSFTDWAYKKGPSQINNINAIK